MHWMYITRIARYYRFASSSTQFLFFFYQAIHSSSKQSFVITSCHHPLHPTHQPVPPPSRQHPYTALRSAEIIHRPRSPSRHPSRGRSKDGRESSCVRATMMMMTTISQVACAAAASPRDPDKVPAPISNGSSRHGPLQRELDDLTAHAMEERTGKSGGDTTLCLCGEAFQVDIV